MLIVFIPFQWIFLSLYGIILKIPKSLKLRGKCDDDGVEMEAMSETGVDLNENR